MATSCSCARARCAGCSQINLPGLEPRGALVADLDLAVGPVRVVAAHLGLLRHSRLMQVEALLAHAGDDTDRPVVFMGDMNEWRRERRSALMRFPPGFGPISGVPSFPAYFPVLALDRVLAQPGELVERVDAHDTPLARLASDHLPVKAVIRLDGTVPDRRGPPRAAGAAPAHPVAAPRREARAMRPTSRRADARGLGGKRPARCPFPRPTSTTTGS